MYTVYLVNFGWEIENTFKSYTSALKGAVDTGFECIIRLNGCDIENVRTI